MCITCVYTLLGLYVTVRYSISNRINIQPNKHKYKSTYRSVRFPTFEKGNKENQDDHCLVCHPTRSHNLTLPQTYIRKQASWYYTTSKNQEPNSSNWTNDQCIIQDTLFYKYYAFLNDYNNMRFFGTRQAYPGVFQL